ncbi:MAG TPA: hypothetical protein VNA29_06115 [Sphingomicrobium sp.]|nr:hypothetical protein [Sphingomicrobium sp.]
MRSRYVGVMQGRHFITFIAIAAMAPSVALAADPVRKQRCPREQAQQQRPQAAQPQQQRVRSQGCPITRSLPPVVDPTPMFLL